MEINFFEKFAGADLDRLAECIKAIREAGLTTDKHTCAGVNENSGNVWVYSEDWVGCVFCSIGFDVAWNWSCSNCGEEWDFKTYSEMETFAAEQNKNTDGEGCEACHTVENV